MEDSYVLELLEPKFKDFHLVYCGYAQCEARHSYGPATVQTISSTISWRGRVYIRWVAEVSAFRRTGIFNRAGDADILSGGQG